MFIALFAPADGDVFAVVLAIVTNKSYEFTHIVSSVVSSEGAQLCQGVKVAVHSQKYEVDEYSLYLHQGHEE